MEERGDDMAAKPLVNLSGRAISGISSDGDNPCYQSFNGHSISDVGGQRNSAYSIIRAKLGVASKLNGTPHKVTSYFCFCSGMKGWYMFALIHR
jgi:hypothetical protein